MKTLIKIASTRMSREGYKTLDHATRPFRSLHRSLEDQGKQIGEYNKAIEGSGLKRLMSGKYSQPASQAAPGPGRKKMSIAMGRLMDKNNDKLKNSERSVVSSVLSSTKVRGNRIKENSPNDYLVGQGKKALSSVSEKARRSMLSTSKRHGFG